MDKKKKPKEIAYKPLPIVYDDDSTTYEDILATYSKRLHTARGEGDSNVQVSKTEITPVDEFWNNIRSEYNFVPDNVVCFGFRRKCSATRRYVLNNLATIMSKYIHCEVFLVGKRDGYGRRPTLAMLVTDETRRLILRNHVITQTEFEGDDRKWDFVWTRMDNAQHARMKEAVYRLVVHEQHRVFSRCNIWCFCFVACFPNYNTRTCSESTILFIQRVYGLQIATNPFAFTPGDVYTFLMQTIKPCIIESLNNMNPTAQDHNVVAKIEAGINNIKI